MLHHLSLTVVDLDYSGAFYDAVLGTLGYVRLWKADLAIGYGPQGEDEANESFAIKQAAEAFHAPGPGFHLAFSAPSRGAVERFHAAAMRHGGRDNGAPSLCPEYAQDYFAAFVFDPDGYRIEALIQGPDTNRPAD